MAARKTTPAAGIAAKAAKKAAGKPAKAVEKAPAKAAAKTAVKTAAKTAATKAVKKPAPMPESEAVAAATQPVDAIHSTAAADAARKPAKSRKQKLVRDSFTMPESEYAVLGEVKKACIAAGFPVKKSELLRVGVALIRTLDNKALQKWVESLPPLKAGRPRKEKQADKRD